MVFAHAVPFPIQSVRRAWDRWIVSGAAGAQLGPALEQQQLMPCPACRIEAVLHLGGPGPREVRLLVRQYASCSHLPDCLAPVVRAVAEAAVPG